VQDSSWIIGVVYDNALSHPQVSVYLMQAGKVTFLDSLDLLGSLALTSYHLGSNKENNPETRFSISALEFAYAPGCNNTVLLYTSLVGPWNLAANSYSFTDIVCHGYEDGKMKLVKNETSLNVEPSQMILDLKCRWSSTEVYALSRDSLYSYAALVPSLKAKNENEAWKPDVNDYFDLNHNPYIQGTVIHDIETNRKKLGGELFIDKMMPVFLGQCQEDLNEPFCYPPRKDADFKDIFDNCVALHQNNAHESNLILFYLALDFEFHGISPPFSNGTSLTSLLHPAPKLSNLVKGYFMLDHGRYRVRFV
jgi:hypothetical protein